MYQNERIIIVKGKKINVAMLSVKSNVAMLNIKSNTSYMLTESGTLVEANSEEPLHIANDAENMTTMELQTVFQRLVNKHDVFRYPYNDSITPQQELVDNISIQNVMDKYKLWIEYAKKYNIKYGFRKGDVMMAMGGHFSMPAGGKQAILDMLASGIIKKYGSAFAFTEDALQQMSMKLEKKGKEVQQYKPQDNVIVRRLSYLSSQITKGRIPMAASTAEPQDVQESGKWWDLVKHIL